MTFKDQLRTLKDNWLLVLLVVVVFGFFLFSGRPSYLADSGFSGIASKAMTARNAGGAEYAEGAYYPSSPSIMPSGGFAPEARERKITKSSSLTAEVEKGRFAAAEAQLKDMVKKHDAFILNENVQKYDSGRREYYRGSFSMKVDTRRYDSFLSQLKQIGKVTYFTENADDITGSYQNAQIELEAEKARLARYKTLFDEAQKMEDKLQLTDRIFNQERTVRYLEDSLTRMDEQVDYASISFSLNEKPSPYATIVFVKFSELVTRFVDSVNGVLRLVFWAVPYLVLVLLVWMGYKFVKKRK